MMKRARISLFLQIFLARLTVGIVAPLYFLFLKGRGYRVRATDAMRRRWKELRKEHPGPWLICGNHLTLIDSMLIVYALMSLVDHWREFRAIPWNLPEKANFQRQLWKAALCYLAKCIPVRRGGNQEEMWETMAKCKEVLRRRQVLMIFPEGGRSRTGRVDKENFSYGVGRLLQDHPSCRVLCVYLRGDGQECYSDLPARGETFTVHLEAFHPRRPEREGLRGQRELAGQIISRLVQMEEKYFAHHRQRYRRFDGSRQQGEIPGSTFPRPGIHDGGGAANRCGVESRRDAVDALGSQGGGLQGGGQVTAGLGIHSQGISRPDPSVESPGRWLVQGHERRHVLGDPARGRGD
ncbi:MAG: lysophospholipid acyltransferase family protein [Pseudomonadota bacterium]|nr:lysophospholipid acyltransferase family protein [Pseudomonadota bacterium]